ncbi:uncharacterized protein LOC116345683 [Contarinia nasturtii]|uniref:uncharacterized protein LOC116345683 n=1 Tax=Contarinia nasturtii TaxID=265458 RepID=UPI0012D46F3B|nr:uncharacterized protein LOC116345683 [Contarinia nasturtii]
MDVITSMIKKALEIWCRLVTLIINIYKTTENFESIRPKKIKHGSYKRNRSRSLQGMHKNKSRNQLEKSSKQITDLSHDCLAKIFNYLSLKEMLNVAHSNKYLKVATEISFRNVYGNHLMTLFDEDICYIETPTELQEKIKKSLQLLRCFGHFISGVKFETNRILSRSLRKHLISYLAKYCTDSLVKIQFDSITCNLLIKQFEFKNTFPKVQSVWLDFYETNTFNLIRPCFSFDVIFPNMEHLTIICNYSFLFEYFLDISFLRAIFTNVEIQTVERVDRSVYVYRECYMDQIFPESGSGPMHRKIYSKKQIRRMDS